MKITIDPSTPPKMTQEMVFLKGQYGLSKYTIPYFSCVVPFTFAQEEFQLIDDIPDSERLDWSLDELFQRDISWKRIRDDPDSLVRYLRNENRPQFFNSLTIALLPRQGHGFDTKYVTQKSYKPLEDPNLEAAVVVGGIQIHGYVGAGGMAGKIRWDSHEIIPVAVDGQHRLAAIKAFKTVAKPEVVAGSTVPVIFIIPDAQVGFVEPQLPKGTAATVSTLRRIFIDLNKNSHQVSKSRQILLDDGDVSSVCVRRMIGTHLRYDPEEPLRIPLALVDWWSETNKIDSGPFLTTVLLLKEFLDLLLEIPFRELESGDIEKVRTWLKRHFYPTPKQEEELITQANRCLNAEVPLTFLPTHVATICSLFEQSWLPHVARIFSELSPYRDIFEYAKDRKVLSPVFTNLCQAEALTDSDRSNSRVQKIRDSQKVAEPDWSYEKDYSVPLEHIRSVLKGYSEEKGTDRWPFRVVFQKALLRSFVELSATPQHFLDDPDVSPQQGRGDFTTKWIQAINALLESPLVSSKAKLAGSAFWMGIALRADGSTIDFTGGGRDRIRRWLNVWVCLYYMTDIPKSLSKCSSEGKEDQMAATLWNMLGKSKQVLAVFKKHAELKDAQDPDKMAWDLCEKRYKHLRALAIQAWE